MNITIERDNLLLEGKDELKSIEIRYWEMNCGRTKHG